jgi:hypothetical protein
MPPLVRSPASRFRNDPKPTIPRHWTGAHVPMKRCHEPSGSKLSQSRDVRHLFGAHSRSCVSPSCYSPAALDRFHRDSESGRVVATLRLTLNDDTWAVEGIKGFGNLNSAAARSLEGAFTLRRRFRFPPGDQAVSRRSVRWLLCRLCIHRALSRVASRLFRWQRC